MKKNLADLRKEYGMKGIRFGTTPDNPLELIKKWLDESLNSGITEPNAMILSTMGKHQRISSRTVLLKGIEQEGLVFYTNYDSRKSEEITTHPGVSLLFLWIELERQVRVEGFAERIPGELSDKYFHSRPRSSQIGAWASPQSKKVKDREELNRKYQEYTLKFEGKEIPRPSNWGGYQVIPDYFEFWQGRAGRMHDRLVYQKHEDDWLKYRLAP